MQSLNLGLGLESLNHSDLSLKFKTALKCISAATEGIAARLGCRIKASKSGLKGVEITRIQ
jgi:hypothetical protein